MATTFLHILSFFLLLLQSFPTISIASRTQKGLTLELIHRDSPSSPLYDPTSTLSDRLRRSFPRLAHLPSRASAVSNGTIAARVAPGYGDYLVKLAIGTPAVEFLAAIDTASDLIWTQCLPCQKCFHQPSPIFDPQNSSTFKNLPCSSSLCSDVGRCNVQGHCEYQVYDKINYWVTNGDLASESFTFGASSNQSAKIPNIKFGCSHMSLGALNGSDGPTAILGLGGGPLSLISQLGSSVDHRFSYCLTLPGSNSSSFLRFGAGAKPPADAGKSIVKSPLAKLPGRGLHDYLLSLTDMSVGSEKLNVPAGTFTPTASGHGQTIIDSSTALTFLAPKAYNLLAAALVKAIKLQPAPVPMDFHSLCFSFVDAGDLAGLPNVTFHLEGGDWVLPPSKAFVVTGSSQGGLVCSTFQPSQSLAQQELTVIGNIALQNMYVEYDLKHNMLLLAPTDCSNSS